MGTSTPIAQMPPGFRQAAPQRSEKAMGLADASKPPGTGLLVQTLYHFITKARDAAMPCAVNSRTRPASVDAGHSSRRPKVRRRRPRRARPPINGRPNMPSPLPTFIKFVDLKAAGIVTT